LLHLWYNFIACFLYFPFFSYRSFNFRDSGKFHLLLAIAFKIEKIATTIAILKVDRAIAIPRAIQKRSNESMHTTDTNSEAKSLRATNLLL
jgi:hypothetical protein